MSPAERRSFPDLTLSPLAATLELTGQTAVVTGGAHGIGLAICRRLSEAGANVVVADRNTHAAESAATVLGEHCIPAYVDVGDGMSIRALAERAVERFGALDVWVTGTAAPTAP